MALVGGYLLVNLLGGLDMGLVSLANIALGFVLGGMLIFTERFNG